MKSIQPSEARAPHRLPAGGLLRRFARTFGNPEARAPHRPPARQHWLGVTALALVCFCPTCKQSATSDAPAPGASAAPPASAVVPAPAAQSDAPPQPGSACAGKYQGEYRVTAIQSDLSKKQGAPEQWEKDDGKALAGKGALTLLVGPDNVVSGTADGALGQQTLRGACDENTLRVQLDAASAESTTIKNAYLIAELSGSEASGTLTAATGDSLIRRAGPVTLRRAP